MFGLAFDIGTTTLAGSLVDLDTGARLAAAGALNPQREYGADVVTRLDAACRSEANLKRMAELLNNELQRLAAELTEKCRPAGRIGVIAFAGNPAMEHLLLGLPVQSLARIPYRPLFNGARRFSSADLGWKPEADVFLFPLPGAFVGGDMVAFLYGSAVSVREEAEEARLYLDLGTNGEIALVAGGCVYVTSAAAGPAFEGGNLSCGMAALPGAIAGVEFSAEKVAVSTIGGVSPVGICGSGVIEALAGLLAAGVIDAAGRLLSPAEIPSNLGVRIKDEGEQRAFVLYRDAGRMVCLTQEDIRRVQLAKAAIRAGMEVLAERAGIQWEMLREVIITGSFAARLRPDHLESLGILDRSMAAKASFTAEGALAGVERALRVPEGFSEVEKLAAKCRVVPLSGNPVFERHFLSRMNFPNQ